MDGFRLALMLAVVTLTAFAGCSGKDTTGNVDGTATTGADGKVNPDQAVQEVNVKATATTGVIRGVVVDAAIRPIAGAAVSVQTAEKILNANTTKNGAFGFQGLKPGTYFLKTSKLGFTAVQTSVDVKAGVSDPNVVKVLLAPDASFMRPYAVLESWKGFLQCGAGQGLTNISGAPPQVPKSLGVNPCAFTGSDNVHVFAVDRLPDLVQSEMVWASTQSAGEDLSIGYFLDGSGTSNYKSVRGPSPLVITTNATLIQEKNKGNLNITVRVFPSSPTLTVTIQQDFNVYVTTFYGFKPRDGWAFNKDGECLKPEQCS